MPLVHYQNINKRSSYAIWHIEEDTDALMTNLSEIDREKVIVKHPKGQAEYAASRLLLKLLCSKKKLPYAGVEKDEHDKPHLIDSMTHISISHSYPFASAMIHLDVSCGIDIERTQEKIRRIKHKFVNPVEEKWVHDSLEKLTIVWSAKETLYKIHGRKKLAFKEDMVVIPEETDKVKSLIGTVNSDNSEKKYNLGIERIEDFIITFLES